MSDAVHEFDCPLCSGGFEIETQWLGGTITCPHCEQEVGLPTAEELDILPVGTEGVASPADFPSAASGPPSTLPAAGSPPQGSPPQGSLPQGSLPLGPPPASKPAEPAARKLTKEERVALRRKINTGIAVVGVVFLVVLFLVLSQLG